MILLVDRRALDLQEETLVVALQEVDGLLRHVGELRSGCATFRVVGARRGWFEVTALGRDRSVPADGHVAVGEESEDGGVLVGHRHPVEFVGAAHHPVAPRFRLDLERLALVFACGGGLLE